MVNILLADSYTKIVEVMIKMLLLMMMMTAL